MKKSTELMILASIAMLVGWIFISDSVGKVIIFSMAFMLWITSYICRAIERNGKER